jgi:hypothetical protein
MPRDKKYETYATVVATITSTPPKQMEKATNIILNDNGKTMDHTPPNMDVPRHEEGVSIKDANPSLTVDPELYRMHSAEHREAVHKQQQ